MSVPARFPTHEEARATAARARARSARFVRWGLVAALAAGTLIGAYAVAAIHLSLGPVRGALVQAHAFAQLFAFVLPIAMGMALRLLPPSPWKRAHRGEVLALALVVAGGVARTAAQVLAWGEAAPAAVGPLAVAGTAALDAAVLTFVLLVGSGVLRRGPSPDWRPDATALGALAFLLLAAGFDAWAARDIARSGVARGAELARVYTAFLDGFASSLIVTVLARTGNVATGAHLPGPRAKGARVLVPIGAALLVAATFLPLAAARAVHAAGVAAWSAGFLAIALPLLRRAASPPADPPSARGFRAALAWVALLVPLRAWLAAAPLVGASAHQFAIDAVRHVFTIGVLAQLIFAALARFGAVLADRKVAHSRLRTAGLVLLNIAVVLRLAQVAAAYWWSEALYVSAASGGVGWVAMGLLAVPVLLALRRRAAP